MSSAVRQGTSRAARKCPRFQVQHPGNEGLFQLPPPDSVAWNAWLSAFFDACRGSASVPNRLGIGFRSTRRLRRPIS